MTAITQSLSVRMRTTDYIMHVPHCAVSNASDVYHVKLSTKCTLINMQYRYTDSE